MELLLKRPALFAQLEDEEAAPSDDKEEDLDEEEMSGEDLGTED